MVGVVVMVGVAVEVGVEVNPIACTSFPASVGSIRAVLVIARIVPVFCKSRGRGFEIADIAQGKSANREQLSSRIPYLRKRKTSLEIKFSCLKTAPLGHVEDGRPHMQQVSKKRGIKQGELYLLSLKE